MVYDAIAFEVMPGDAFGSGKLPPKSAGPIFWPATFDLKERSNQPGSTIAIDRIRQALRIPMIAW